MDIFRAVKVVRLRSNQGAYLVAAEDGKSVSLHRNGSCREARWTVDCTILGLHLRSCYGLYLTALSTFQADTADGVVVQELPDWRCLDPSVQWKPIGRGACVMLRTRNDKFLRANRDNSVTHSSPSRSSTLDWMLWDVDFVEDNPDPTYETLQVIAVVVIGLVFLWFAHYIILGLFYLISQMVLGVCWLVSNIFLGVFWLISKTVLGLLWLGSNIAFVVLWLGSKIIFVPTWLVFTIGSFASQLCSWIVNHTWSAIIILWGGFGILFQIVEFYEKINNLLDRFARAR